MATDAVVFPTTGSIPEWFISETVNLNDYITAHIHRSVIRIFAREVLLTEGTFNINGDIARIPVDIRIDCHALRVRGKRAIDVSGSDKSLGWKSFQPIANKAGENGEAGYDGGTIIINALTVVTEADGHLDLLANGGAGGAGQKGSWGEAGHTGEDGVNCQLEGVRAPGTFDVATKVKDRGSPPRDGGVGAAGTSGGNGGKGGAAGSLTVNCTVGTSSTFSLTCDPGKGGAAGPGGRGGGGGLEGKPSEVVTSDDMLFWANVPTLIATATKGSDGPDGPPGKSGDIGAAGVKTLNGITAAAIAAEMAKDTVPHSLRLRMHRLLNAGLYALTKPGFTLKEFFDRYAWLVELASLLGYADVLSRFGHMILKLAQASNLNLLQLLGPQLVNAELAAPDFESVLLNLLVNIADVAQTLVRECSLDFAQMLNGQRLTMKQDVLAAGFELLKCVDTVAFSSDHPRLAALAQRAAAVEAGRQLDLDTFMGDASNSARFDIYTAIRQYLSQDAGLVQASNGFVPLAPILGDKAVLPVREASLGAELTEAEITATELAMLGPEGALAAAGILVVGILSDFLYSSVRRAEAEAWQAYADAMRRYERDIEQWREEQRGRDEEEAANQRQYDNEDRRRKRRKIRGDESTATKTAISLYGSAFVGILDKLEECEGDEKGSIAVFDGYLHPNLGNGAAEAAFITAEFAAFSFMLTIQLTDAQSIESLQPGEWYVVTREDAQAPERPNGADVIETFINVPSLAGLSLQQPSQPTQGKLAWCVASLPPLPIRVASIKPADDELIHALEWILQFEQIPTRGASSDAPPARNSSGPVVVEVNVEDVGQGTFHRLRAAPGQMPSATQALFPVPYDPPAMVLGVGYGSPRNSITADALTWCCKCEQTPIVVSHWDMDHYKALTTCFAAETLQQTNPVLGPSYGLKGVTIGRLIRALASHGPGHLYLAGELIAAYALDIPGIYRDTSIPVDLLPIPANISLSLTTKPVSGSYDKNNVGAISAVASGAGGRRMLFPGDASFFYIQDSHRRGLTWIEATHHGSLRSILTAEGRPRGTKTDNDIPLCADTAQLSVVAYSYGLNNRYGIKMSATSDFYEEKEWTRAETTAQPPPVTPVTINPPRT